MIINLCIIEEKRCDMKKETKDFIKNLTLQTPLLEIKEYCKTEEDTLLIMSHLYKLMANEPNSELSEGLKFTFAGEKVQPSQTTYITIEKWQEILDSYYHAKDEIEKLKAFQKIVQVIECGVKVIGGVEKILTEQEKKQAKEMFKDIPKEQLKISLIQRKMQIGYGKAARIKDFLFGED
jgi:DNA segregation ATPase FtsK/SpoIIIE-like protein